jgi:DNA-binding NarL/FixJ family response regulator
MTTLTRRQREIMELRLQGLMHKQIARRLTLSQNTVRNTVSAAYERLGIPKQGFYSEKLRTVRSLVEQEVSA